MACAERPASPHVPRARVDRVRTRHRVRVADLRPIERGPLAAVDDGRGDYDPPLGVAVAEVRVAETARELVEAPRRIGRIVTRIAAVPVDHLRERLGAEL